MSVARVQEETTSREFVQWQKYLDDEEEKTTKIEHYYAQIIAEIRRQRARYPEQIKKDHFIMKSKIIYKEDKLTITPKEKAKRSKAIWLGMFGFKPEDMERAKKNV